MYACILPLGCQDFVYTNYTYIPGEPTLPDEMYDTDCSACKSIEETKERKHPWNAPGTAPTYGNGCGANGGNPNGCMLHWWTTGPTVPAVFMYVRILTYPSYPVYL